MKYGKYPAYINKVAIVKDKFGRYQYHYLYAIVHGLYPVDGYIFKVIEEWIFYQERKLINMVFKEVSQ